MVKTHRSLGAGFGREMNPFFCQRLSGDYVCCQKKDRCSRKVKRRYLREYNLLLEAFCEKGTNTFNCDQCFHRCENVHMSCTKVYCLDKGWEVVYSFLNVVIPHFH